MAPKTQHPAAAARKSAKETTITKKPTGIKKHTPTQPEPSAKLTSRQKKLSDAAEEATAAKPNISVKRAPAESRPKMAPKSQIQKAAATSKSAPASKKAPTKKTTESKTAPSKEAKKRVSTEAESKAERGTKRARTSDSDQQLAKKAAPSKKTPASTDKSVAQAKPLKPKRVINSVPSTKLHIYVFGDGSAGELGLGATKKATDVKGPRLNTLLEAAGVVDVAVGGMHCVALTADNKIITWGVNDNNALGRDTKWEAKTRDADADESGSDSEDDDPGLDLNPLESTPTAIPAECFPEDIEFVQVAAGDSISLALTDSGLVYGWGTFRDDKGVFGFSQIQGEEVVPEQARPVLINGLKGIKQIACGENHALALDEKGTVWAWGCGKQDQLGRRLVGRHLQNNLNPSPLGSLPKKNQIISISAGLNHSFAIQDDGTVWAWGLNNHMQTGIPYAKPLVENTITGPHKVEALKNVKMMGAGANHSIALTQDGDLYSFGQLENSALGVDWKQYANDPEMIRRGGSADTPKILIKPVKVPIGHTMRYIACGPDHNIAITTEGRSYSWGFNTSYNCGIGETDGDVETPTLMDGRNIREQKLVWAGCGGQFSLVGSAVEGQADAGEPMEVDN